MATVLDYLVRLLVFCGFVICFIGLYRTYVLHSLWRKEKGWGRPLLLDGWFELHMSEEFKAQRRRVLQATIAFLVIWLIGVVLISAMHSASIYPLKRL